MRGFVAFLLLMLIGLNLATAWQVRRLQMQVDALQAHVQQVEHRSGGDMALLDRALSQLELARAAVQNADFEKARALLNDTVTRANQISHAVGDKTTPAVTWLRQQARLLEQQIDRK